MTNSLKQLAQANLQAEAVRIISLPSLSPLTPEEVKTVALHYCPQGTMMLNADHLLDRIERAIRIVCIKKIDASYFPPELDRIIDLTEDVVEDFVEANKLFFSDFEKASKLARKVEGKRDEVRDLFYILSEKIVNDELPRGTSRILNATTRISIEAEQGTDYLKVLIAKHS